MSAAFDDFSALEGAVPPAAWRGDDARHDPAATAAAADDPGDAAAAEGDPPLVFADALPAAGSEELAALLAEVARGRHDAFRRLYGLTRLRLFALVLRIQRDRPMAEDVLQEVYVSIWRAAADFDARLARPMTWMGTIARHRAIDSLRRRRAEPRWATAAPAGAGDDEPGPDPLDQLESPEEGPLERLQRAGEAVAMQRCIGGLSREQQLSVSMAFYQGLSHGEVAEHLGQPLGTVKSWVRRGLLALRTCLERAEAGAGRVLNAALPRGRA